MDEWMTLLLHLLLLRGARRGPPSPDVRTLNNACELGTRRVHAQRLACTTRWRGLMEGAVGSGEFVRGCGRLGTAESKHCNVLNLLSSVWCVLLVGLVITIWFKLNVSLMRRTNILKVSH